MKEIICKAAFSVDVSAVARCASYGEIFEIRSLISKISPKLVHLIAKADTSKFNSLVEMSDFVDV
jgi:hypothetical protein